jgi:UDP-4-amino-4,6-dideoxy-N-acetyl-beta-L-altrosamine transaminase
VIPYSHQSIDDEDIAAVVNVLKGDWLTTGPAVEEFEAALAAKVDAKHVVAFANGTAALHGACAAAGLGPGDRVATSTLSFAASASCALYVGASPLLLDIDPATLNVDPASVPDGLDALVAVHFAGLPMDLASLAHRPRVLIEDAAHALGATTPDGPVGSCARSDLCCFSFHPVKAITTGEGGAVSTNDDGLAERLRRFRNHGMVRTPDEGAWAYEIDEVGFNYRLTDLQAALGTSQLAKLERFVARRNELADRYRVELASLPVELPPAPGSGFTHAYHLFAARVPNRRAVFDELRARGIGVQVHYAPIHRHPAYERLGFRREDFPAAEAAYAGLLSLPLYPDLTATDQDTVIATLREVLA